MVHVSYMVLLVAADSIGYCWCYIKFVEQFFPEHVDWMHQDHLFCAFKYEA